MVAVFTVPDVGGRPDPLAEAAEADGVPVLKFKQWRKKGQAIPEVSKKKKKQKQQQQKKDFQYNVEISLLLLWTCCIGVLE